MSVPLKDGSRIAPGAVTQGIKAVLQQSAGARGFSAFLRAFRAFFGQVFKTARSLSLARQEGKLSADWESQLDELLGIDSQDRFESEAAAEADAIANEALYAGGASYSEENPGPNGETFSLRKGASVNSQKKLIPKTADKMPRFQSRGTFEEVRSQVVDWMKANPTAVTPDGKNILINNPEGGSLEKRAEHWMGSHAKDDPWRKGGRNPRPDKLESIAAIPATISGAQAEALATSGKTVYLRRYSDDKLHAVFVDRENRVTEHGLIDGSVVTQYTLDPRKGIEGAKIVHDWTIESPAYSVNPVKGAESDRVMTPGPQPMDQRNDTPSPSAQQELTADGEIVNSAETHSLRKFDFSSKLAPAAEILRNMRQGGKAFDFATAYRAASAGQSTSMQPLSALYDEAKKLKRRPKGKMPGKSRADSPKRVPFEGQEASWTLNGSHL